MAVKPISIERKPDKGRPRLAYLDYLRGIAIVLVMIQHFGERSSDLIAEFTSTKIQLGQLGVMIFFACSGFIIPTSIKNSDSVVRFWIARFFRLYPLYWAALFMVWAGTQLQLFEVQSTSSFTNWMWNISMLQRFADQVNVIGVSWTLFWEMAFYFLVTGLFIMRLNKFSFEISIVCNAMLIAFAGLKQYLPDSITYSSLFFAISVMFLGSVFYSWVSERLETAKLVVAICLTLVTAVIMLYRDFGFVGDASIEQNGVGRFSVMFSSYSLAILIFGFTVIRGSKGRNFPLINAISRIGIYSYSLYLMHAVVIELFSLNPANKDFVTLVSALALTIGLSFLTFRYIEKPGIALGRKITNKYFPAKNPEAQRAVVLGN